MHTVAGGVLLPIDEGLGMEQTPVRAIPDFIDDIGLEIDVQGAWHMLARRRLRKECAETVIGIRTLRQTTVRLDILDQLLILIKTLWDSRSDRARRCTAPLR